KHEQSHIQAEAGLAKAAQPKEKKAVRGPKTAASQTKVSPAVTKKNIAAPVKAPTVTGAASHLASVIIRPRVTEKSGILSQANVYTFEIARHANKSSVAKAVAALYKVKPIKVAVINTPTRHVFVKGKRGAVAGIRKALVTVKQGDKIDFV
ncbi:MAG: 50S ribosomal protein L23, partial [Patescibacteria group bacterium]|nr:50S ribosomal protein L23 [Patescibacteria group bacterium]